ncbi:MAG TPA: hypothetical protein DG754_00995 [Bacteroidales bacterium]|nr:hypothetical protein [Bacteroidales bacterium]
MGIIKFKHCPCCNALFDCYCKSDKECWCTAFKLSPQKLEELAQKYAGCLCPDCLKRFSQEDN